MLLDILDMVWQSKSTDQNQASLTNMYLEADSGKGKYKVIALPMPGLRLFKNLGNTAYIRDMYELNNQLYVVAGNSFINLKSDLSTTTYGTLNTSTGWAKIRAITGGSNNNNQLIVADGTNGYGYNLGTATGQFPIADGDFPQTCVDIENQDDYILAVQSNSMQFQVSNVSNSVAWDALDFASKYGQPDNINAIVSHESKIWLFGNKTTEIWYNTGDALFAFGRMSDTFLHYGCSAKRSIAVNGNYFIFLTSNAHGSHTIVQTLPRVYFYNPSPISTAPIDSLLNSFTTINDCFASIYNQDGHEFYQVTFPSEDTTLIYDVPKNNQSDEAKGTWYYRKSYNTTTSQHGKFLGSCAVYCYGKNLVGDASSGKIYVQDTEVYTENGNPMLREFISPPGQTYQEGKLVFFHKLQIDVETGIGANKTFTLEKSADNGDTWQLVNTYTVPNKGFRIYENRLGSSRFGMIFRIRTTMDAKFIILGFQVEASLGHS